MMTQQTLTAFFDNRTEAQQAIDELVSAGIPRTSIRLLPETEERSTASTGQAAPYDANRDEKGFWATLGDLFLPEDDRYTYAEAMNRGSIMVSVTVDASLAERAEDVLERHGTVNMDEREEAWRKEGWAGHADRGTMMGGTGDTAHAAAAGATSRGATGQQDEAIPIVEEQLRIGKRQVSGGRVKVRSYVVETPVRENVTLRSENVHVERRSADRELTAAESERLFQERTIDAQAVSEEAVVSKTARVTGEVHLKKDVEERTETVEDRVRSTKVDVDDETTAASDLDPASLQRR